MLLRLVRSPITVGCFALAAIVMGSFAYFNWANYRPNGIGIGASKPLIVEASKALEPESSPFPPASEAQAASAQARPSRSDARNGQRPPLPIDLPRVKIRVEQKYGRLFQRLTGISPDSLERLKDVLVAAEWEEYGQLNLTGKESPAEIVQRMAEIQRIEAGRDEMIADILGQENFSKYLAYQQSSPYRSTVEEIANGMRAQGISISFEQEDRLLDTYASAIRSATEMSSVEANTEEIATMTPEQRAKLRERQLARLDQIIAEAFSHQLDPATFKIFLTAQLAQDTGHP
jgi:hypothetical protein